MIEGACARPQCGVAAVVHTSGAGGVCAIYLEDAWRGSCGCCVGDIACVVQIQRVVCEERFRYLL